MDQELSTADHTVRDQHTACSCAGHQPSRRGLITGLGLAAGATALSGLTDGVFRRVAYGAESTGQGNVIVVLSLRGGADGLSMVVPHGDPGYARARPRIAVPRSRLLANDGFFGLHPAFQPLLPMWQGRKLAAVQAVGLPAPNRSHFAALEEIEDADPGSAARVGWLNRLVGSLAGGSPLEAVNVGQAMIPTSLYGPQATMGIRKTSTIGLPGSPTGERAAWKRAGLEQMWRSHEGPVGLAGESALDASRRLAPLASARPAPGNGARYPATPLGEVMADTARLIKAGIGVRAVTVDFGSWDMHVNVGNLQQGLMAPMIDELARAIAGLFTDLGTMGSRVTLVTLSEFGRRVGENDNAGLDHGYGNLMLVAGGGVRGGRVYGSWPGLQSPDLVNGDLAVTRDYRSVLSEVAGSRLGVSSARMFPGFVPERALGLMA